MLKVFSLIRNSVKPAPKPVAVATPTPAPPEPVAVAHVPPIATASSDGFNKAAFYKTVRSRLGPLKQSQVDGFEYLLAAISGAPLAHAAYMLATAWHETGATMQPVREAHWLSEAWRKKNLRYWPHYGRGYVQITWPHNYEWLDKAAYEAGLTKRGEILNNLDLAMRPDIAAFALRKGMEEGRYDSQGRTMAQRLPSSGVATKAQYINARYLVNIQDKAEQIEGYAQAFERALRDGGWA